METAAPHLPIKHLRVALDVVRRQGDDARAVNVRCLIALRLPQAERDALLAEARSIAESLPEKGDRDTTPRQSALAAVRKASGDTRNT